MVFVTSCSQPFRRCWRIRGAIAAVPRHSGVCLPHPVVFNVCVDRIFWSRRGCASATQAPEIAGNSTDGRIDSSVAGNAAANTDSKATVDDELEDGEIPPEVEQLFGTLRDEALRRLDEFGPIHLFSLCWAYSTARLLDEDLEVQIQRAALRLGQARDLEPHSIREKKDRRERGQNRRGMPPRRDEGQPSASNAHESADALLTDGRARDETVFEKQAGSEHTDSAVQETQHEVPSVLRESENWMVLYKPPFWQVSVDSKEAAKAAAVGPFEEEDDGDMDDASNPEENRRRPRVQGWIQQNMAAHRPIHSDPIEAFGLLHRLDVQTSGILMCAKTYVGAYWLRLQWCSYAVDKEYVCLVHGWVDRSTREIHKRIRVDKKKAPNSRRTISTQCSVSDSGKPSFTELVTLAYLTAPVDPEAETSTDSPPTQQSNDGKYSLVVLKLHTGRTHQIRVHMQSIGHPLVCDIKYAADRFAEDRKWCPRNFLHTYRLAFDDVPSPGAMANLPPPETHGDSCSGGDSSAASGLLAGEAVEVFCPLPKDLRGVLEQLSPIDEVSASSYRSWLAGEVGQMRRFENVAEEADAAASAAGKNESATANP